MSKFTLKRKLFNTATVVQQPAVQQLTPAQQQALVDQQQQKANMVNNNYTGLDSTIANTTTGLGKAGLFATAGLGAATAVELGNAAHSGVKAAKSAKELAKEIESNPELLKAIKNGAVNVSSTVADKLRGFGIPIPELPTSQEERAGLFDKALEFGKKGFGTYKEYYKGSKIDKGARYLGYLNTVIDTPSRTMLNTLPGVANLGVNSFINTLKSPLNKEENEVLSEIMEGKGHDFKTQKQLEGFLEKLKSRLSPEELEKVADSIKNKKSLDKKEVEAITGKLGSWITESAEKKLRTVPNIVGHAANALTHLKNVKMLGKATAGLAGVSGLAYFQGKSLQDYRNSAKNTEAPTYAVPVQQYPVQQQPVDNTAVAPVQQYPVQQQIQQPIQQVRSR